MTLAEYKIKAVNTMATIGTHKDDIYHMGLGVFTEVGEILDIFKKNHAYSKVVDNIHLSEEIGDLFWYLSNSYLLLDSSFPTTIQKMPFSLPALSRSASECFGISSYYKNVSITSPKTLKEFKSSIDAILSLAVSLIDSRKLDLGLILDANINKLMARYPEKFSSDRALNRDLDNEYKILKETIK